MTCTTPIKSLSTVLSATLTITNLDFLVIRKIILRMVYFLEHVQQFVNVRCLGEHCSLLLRFSSQLGRSRFW